MSKKTQTASPFEFCAFHGPAPAGYKNWGEWMIAPTKKGAYIRAAEPEDFHAPQDNKRKKTNRTARPVSTRRGEKCPKSKQKTEP